MGDRPKQLNLNSWLNIVQLIVLIGGGVYMTAQNNAKIDAAIKLLDRHSEKIDKLEQNVSEIKGEMTRVVKAGGQ